MTENEARYIVRMIQAFRENIMFVDATDQDCAEIDRMKTRYHDAGGWSQGLEAALADFILRVSENGVLGGVYMNMNPARIAAGLQQRGLPLIKRNESNGLEQ